MTTEQQTPAHLALYHFESCPYCVLVRNAIRQLGIANAIELRDILAEPAHRRELIQGGGMSQVPCLRMDYPDGRSEWLYESADIIAYLRQRFG